MIKKSNIKVSIMGDNGTFLNKFKKIHSYFFKNRLILKEIIGDAMDIDIFLCVWTRLCPSSTPGSSHFGFPATFRYELCNWPADLQKASETRVLVLSESRLHPHWMFAITG